NDLAEHVQLFFTYEAAHRNHNDVLDSDPVPDPPRVGALVRMKALHVDSARPEAERRPDALASEYFGHRRRRDVQLAAFVIERIKVACEPRAQKPETVMLQIVFAPGVIRGHDRHLATPCESQRAPAQHVRDSDVDDVWRERAQAPPGVVRQSEGNAI